MALCVLIFSFAVLLIVFDLHLKILADYYNLSIIKRQFWHKTENGL